MRHNMKNHYQDAGGRAQTLGDLSNNKKTRRGGGRFVITMIGTAFVVVVLVLTGNLLTSSSTPTLSLSSSQSLSTSSSSSLSSSSPDDTRKKEFLDRHDAGVPADVEGTEGGAWTAETHLSTYGFNVDWGLLEVLEASCRDAENSRIPEESDKWHQYQNTDTLHPLNKMWVPPNIRNVNCRVLEVGCGVGVYVDALKKEKVKINRKVIGIEPNPMGGTFNRGLRAPKQLAIDILSFPDVTKLAKDIRTKQLGGKYFDLIYSIEVFEHMPLDRHDDAVQFLAASSQKGTKLIFGAAKKGQAGVGHIGGRSTDEWEKIMAKHGFVKDAQATADATQTFQEFNHRSNTNVYFFTGDE